MDLGKGYYSENTPEIVELSELSREADLIENELFVKYDVKRGLRDLNGKGVLTGLTRISEIIAKKVVDGNEVEMYVKVGDKVIASKYAGTDVKIDGEEYTIVRQSDILATVE